MFLLFRDGQFLVDRITVLLITTMIVNIMYQNTGKAHYVPCHNQLSKHDVPKCLSPCFCNLHNQLTQVITFCLIILECNRISNQLSGPTGPEACTIHDRQHKITSHTNFSFVRSDSIMPTHPFFRICHQYP